MRQSPLSRDESDGSVLETTQAYLRSLAGGSSIGASTDPTSARSFERFYAQYDPFLRRVIGSWHMSAADSEDCVQEIWTEIVRKLGSFQFDPQRGTVEAWLFTLARRQMIHFRRRASRSAFQNAPKLVESTRSHDPDPATVCERREDRQRIRRTLSAMRTRVSETNYRVLRLRWIDEKSAPEIARAVDLKPEQVRYRLGRMKRKVERMLNTRNVGPAMRNGSSSGKVGSQWSVASGQ